MSDGVARRALFAGWAAGAGGAEGICLICTKAGVGDWGRGIGDWGRNRVCHLRESPVRFLAWAEDSLVRRAADVVEWEGEVGEGGA